MGLLKTRKYLHIAISLFRSEIRFTSQMLKKKTMQVLFSFFFNYLIIVVSIVNPGFVIFIPQITFDIKNSRRRFDLYSLLRIWKMNLYICLLKNCK